MSDQKQAEVVVKGREPKVWEALGTLGLMMVAIIATMKLGVGMQTPLLLGAIIAATAALLLGYKWKDIETGLLSGISNGLVCIVILILVGAIIGLWLLGGTVPTLIYYGLKFVTPSIFLPVTFVLCCITSLATGTSFGTLATVGLAMMGVGLGLGIPPVVTAGCIASGSFFGDKMSPLSDTTNVAPAMAGTTVYEHIASMLWTTVPATIICLIVYGIMGIGYAKGGADFQTVNTIVTTIGKNFNVSLLTLVPPLVVIVLSLARIPAMIGLAVSAVVSALFAIITQSGVGIKAVVGASMSGYIGKTGVGMVDKILTRGGINMMAGTIMLVIIATAMGGILEKSCILKVLVDVLMKFIKRPRDLILATLASIYMTDLVSGNMMLAIILPGRTFKPAYEKMNIHPKVLSRTLEDAGTLGTVIIPWGTSALYLMGVLSVGPGYIPYTFLSFLCPIFAIIYAFTGIGVWKTDGTKMKMSEM